MRYSKTKLFNFGKGSKKDYISLHENSNDEHVENCYTDRKAKNPQLRLK